MCLISIIIPVYNVEAYLEECLESVIHQDFDSFEIILVNDGSTDNSGKICKEYSRNFGNITLIEQKNAGLSAARNIGINRAKGKYILFLDSDDFWQGEFIKDLAVSRLAGNSDIILCDYTKYQRGKFVKVRHQLDREYVQSHNAEEVFLYLLEKNAYEPSAWSKICKKEWLMDHGLYFKEGIKSEDLEWSLRIISNKPKFDYYDNSFYVYRLGRDGSISNTYSMKHGKDFLSVINQYESYAKGMKKNNAVLYREVLNYCAFLVMVLIYYDNKIRKPEKRKYRSMVREKIYLLKCAKRGPQYLTKYTCLILRYPITAKILFAGRKVMQKI